MQKEIVTIKRVDTYGVTYTNGLGASKDNFPGAKPGQEWEVTTTSRHSNFPNTVFPKGVIVSTRLVTDV